MTSSAIDQRRSTADALRLEMRRQLPARIREILQHLLNLCRSSLEPIIDQVLRDTEEEIFRVAEKSRSNDTQQRAFDTLREFKHNRGEFTEIFWQWIEDALARFDEIATVHGAKNPDGDSTRRHPELSLIDTIDLEHSLALQEIKERLYIRHSQKLHPLGYRFGVLAAAPVFDAEILPLGPATLCAALRDSSEVLNIESVFNIMLYRRFDRLAATEIGTLYEVMNRYLADQGILKHLHAEKLRARENHVAVSAPQATTVAPEESAAAVAEADKLVPTRDVSPATPSEPLKTPHEDLELFNTLRQLLAARQAATQPADAFAQRPIASMANLQDALKNLQIGGGSHTDGASTNTDYLDVPSPASLLSDQIKRDLRHELGKLRGDGITPALAPRHADTIDLVGLLMQQMRQDLPRNAATAHLINHLHTPLLRVALRDDNFFTQRAHPARQLLNTLADASQNWLDDSGAPADPALSEKMKWMVERLNSESNISADSFGEMQKDLSQHLQMLAQKAEIAERRAIESAKGRERLEDARRVAHAAIDERVGRTTPPELLQTLLEQAWTDVLTLTLLRQGKDSAAYARHLDIVDTLLASSKSENPPPTREIRGEVEASLSQVGVHSEDVKEITFHLFRDRPAASNDDLGPEAENIVRAEAASRLTQKLKHKPRLGEDPSASGTKADASVTSTVLRALTGVEQKVLAELKTLPFGTWFEFVVNQRGDRVRRRLAWYSTVTGHCLFVNARGIRADERSLDQVAMHMASGQIRLAQPERESLVDRALKSIVRMLRQATGRKPVADTVRGSLSRDVTSVSARKPTTPNHETPIQ